MKKNIELLDITRDADDSRGISLNEIKEAIAKGKLVQTYPKDSPYPSCLILGYIPVSEFQ